MRVYNSKPPSWISDFWFLCGTFPDSTNEKFNPENKGVVVGIFFLSGLQAEIHLGGTFTSPWVCTGVKLLGYMKVNQKSSNFNFMHFKHV